MANRTNRTYEAPAQNAVRDSYALTDRKLLNDFERNERAFLFLDVEGDILRNEQIATETNETNQNGGAQ